MIARIVIGSGNARTALTMIRDKDTRRSLANKLKPALFPTNALYHAAKARGQQVAA